MERGSVKVKFVGSEDVVEHIISRTNQKKRKSLAMQIGTVVEEESRGVEEEADYKLHRMCKDLTKNNCKDDVTKLFTPQSILKRRSSVTPNGMQLPPPAMTDPRLHERATRKPLSTHKGSFFVSTPTKASLSTPTKASSSSATPVKSTASAAKASKGSSSSQTPSSILPSNKSFSNASSKTSLSRTPSKKSAIASTTPTAPPRTPLRLPRKTPMRLRKIEEMNGSSSDSDTEVEYEEEEEEDEDSKVGKEKRISYGEVVKRQAVEEYFHSHHKTLKSRSSSTSNHLLRRKLDAYQVGELLRGRGEGRGRRLLAGHEKCFQMFYYLLMHDFNILLHGLGSKMNLISKFHKKFLRHFHCVVVNGFFPGLTFKHIIAGLLELLGVESALPAAASEQVAVVREALWRAGNPDVFLLINNIDGFNLRDHKSQLGLSLLSSLANIRLVASVDHINSPLLWDQSKLQRFNWISFETTTFECYVSETTNENSLLVEASGLLQLTSLEHIMRSLTTNACGIFSLLCRHQLQNSADACYQGLAFCDLYRKCREAFLVNSEPTLRSQLVEFKDHAMIRVKKGLDGVDYVTVSIDDATISTFLEKQE